jgi:hypothetical protein
VHLSDWKVQASQCRLTSSDDICSSQLCQFWHLRVFSSFPDLSSSPQQFGHGLGWGEGGPSFVAVLKSVRRCVC